MKPRLSVLVPAMRGYDSVLGALDSWEAQSCGDELEILVLCPTAEETGTLPRRQRVVDIGSRYLHEARMVGILEARAEYIVLAEDHCVPDPFWAEAVLQRLSEGWDVIGPALRPGNPDTNWNRASFLLGYGQWMSPITGGPATVLPGHNTVIRKSALLEMGEPLERMLLIGAFLLRRLRETGHRFYLDPRATMRHFDMPGAWRTLQVFACVGLGFGAARTSRWPLVGRLLYPLAFPAIAAGHWKRALTQYRRAGRQAGLNPSCLINALWLSLIWAGGEALGSLMGFARAAPFVALAEIKPLTRSELGPAPAVEGAADQVARG